MSIFLPPIFLIVIGLVIGFRMKMKFGIKNNYREKMDQYIKDEQDVNMIRKKELDEKYFVAPNLKNLPVTDYAAGDESEAAVCQSVVLQKSKNRMVHFEKKMSNLELKKIYGINNLQRIIDFEEHFNMYIVALNKWSEALIKEERFGEAEKVLSEAVAFGSDYLMTYTLLIDMYMKNKQKSKIDRLKEDVQRDKFFDDSILKNRVLNYVSYKFGA